MSDINGIGTEIKTHCVVTVKRRFVFLFRPFENNVPDRVGNGQLENYPGMMVHLHRRIVWINIYLRNKRNLSGRREQYVCLVRTVDKYQLSFLSLYHDVSLIKLTQNSYIYLFY